MITPVCDGMPIAMGKGMTAPRQILAGATYLVTRRCSERRLFLRPSAAVNAIFRYVLAVAAERYEIQVHAYCVLSNHFHLLVTDPRAQLPDFHRYLDGLVARAINAAMGRWEAFWDPESYSAVRLEDAATIFDKLVYVLLNPVAAGLVRRGSEWPGLWSDPGLIGGEPVQAARPERFFRKKGVLPEVAQLRLQPPPGFEADEAFVERLRARVHEEEDAAAARHQREGRSFLTAAKALAQRPTARPAQSAPRRRLNPRVACRDPEQRIGALERLREFARDYRKALAAWREGVRDALFPEGTWLMRVRHSARCASLG